MESKVSKLGLLKSMFTAKSAVRGGIIVVVALMAWYQFGGAEKNMLALLKSDTAAFIHSARTFLTSSAGDEKLSTGAQEANAGSDRISATWQFQKAQNGESIWMVYTEATKGNTEIVFRAQVVNGLKNITILQNNIPDEHIAHNSLTAGKEYSFLNSDAVAKYAGKVKEANEKLQGGAHLNELSGDLQLAYRIANVPSYQFLHSLPQDTLHSVYE